MMGVHGNNGEMHLCVLFIFNGPMGDFCTPPRNTEKNRKLSYRRDSARRRSLCRSNYNKVIDVGTKSPYASE